MRTTLGGGNSLMWSWVLGGGRQCGYKQMRR
jgi:hypothetical protein